MTQAMLLNVVDTFELALRHPGGIGVDIALLQGECIGYYDI